MAVQPIVVERRTTKDVLIQWAPLANGDTGQPYNLGGLGGISPVLVQGTLGAGGSATVDVSFDGGQTWINPPGALVDFPVTSGLPIYSTGVAAPMFRPHVTAGDNTTSITYTLYVGFTPVPGSG